MPNMDKGLDLENDHIQLPAVMEKHERIVTGGFWKKFRRYAGNVPFAEDLVSAYYCAMDRRTPTRVRGVLLAALAYFVMPADMIPDFIFGLGFTDDAAVLATALAMIRTHMKPEHRQQESAEEEPRTL